MEIHTKIFTNTYMGLCVIIITGNTCVYSHHVHCKSQTTNIYKSRSVISLKNIFIL